MRARGVVGPGQGPVVAEGSTSTSVPAASGAGSGSAADSLGLGGGVVLESSAIELAHSECLGAAQQTFRKEAVDDASKSSEHERMLLQRVS